MVDVVTSTEVETEPSESVEICVFVWTIVDF